MKEMIKAQEAAEEANRVYGLWNMFSAVTWNILDSPEVKDKKKAISSALDEFKSSLATKSLLQEFSEITPEPHVVEETELQKAYKSLEQVFIEQKSLVGISSQDRLAAVQPALDALGNTLISEMNKSEPVVNENDTVSDGVDEKISKATQPITEQLSLLMAMVEKLTPAANPQTEVKRVPQPRSVNPLVVQQSMTQQEQRKLTPIELAARRSVGLPE